MYLCCKSVLLLFPILNNRFHKLWNPEVLVTVHEQFSNKFISYFFFFFLRGIILLVVHLLFLKNEGL